MPGLPPEVGEATIPSHTQSEAPVRHDRGDPPPASRTDHHTAGRARRAGKVAFGRRGHWLGQTPTALIVIVGVVSLLLFRLASAKAAPQANDASIEWTAAPANQTTMATRPVSADVAASVLPPLPTPTPVPPAPTDIPGPDDPHVNYSVDTPSCAGCHSTHTSTGIALRQAWPEEDNCFQCHAEGGPGTDVYEAFRYVNTDTRFFKHDVGATAGVHRVGQSDGSDYAGDARHVECEDCHEPHEATRGWAPAPMLPREMTDVSGVDPTWSGSGAPTAFVWLPQAEREYQVCFKCHSSFTSLPTYSPAGWDGREYVEDGLAKLTSANPAQAVDSRDLAQELNPYHASFHPVVTQGRNQSIPADTFVPGWSQTSLVYCTDCHTSAIGTVDGLGPHGSPRLHILDGQADYTTVYRGGSKVDSQEICFKCHRYDTYVSGTIGYSNFPHHERHMNNNRGTTCYTCHDSHGSEQLHLINFDASVVSFLDDRDSQTAWFTDSDGESGCYLVCHGRRHDPEIYAR